MNNHSIKEIVIIACKQVGIIPWNMNRVMFKIDAKIGTLKKKISIIHGASASTLMPIKKCTLVYCPIPLCNSYTMLQRGPPHLRNLRLVVASRS